MDLYAKTFAPVCMYIFVVFLSEKHERPGPDLVVGVGGGRPGVGGEEPQEESPPQEHGHGPGMSHEPHLTSHTDLVQPECV